MLPLFATGTQFVLSKTHDFGESVKTTRSQIFSTILLYTMENIHENSVLVRKHSREQCFGEFWTKPEPRGRYDASCIQCLLTDGA